MLPAFTAGFVRGLRMDRFIRSPGIARPIFPILTCGSAFWMPFSVFSCCCFCTLISCCKKTLIEADFARFHSADKGSPLARPWQSKWAAKEARTGPPLFAPVWSAEAAHPFILLSFAGAARMPDNPFPNLLLNIDFPISSRLRGKHQTNPGRSILLNQP
jgi:hypothetical protein